MLRKDKYVGRKIKMVNPLITNGIYQNLTLNSVHVIIAAPGITPNSEKGVWVKGDREYVYVETKEFVFVDVNKKIIFKRNVQQNSK
jgi:hypothetical protein